MQVIVKGVEQALRAIKRYENIQEKLLEIATRLCEIGEPIISGVHGPVSPEPTDTGCKITASGPDVLFIEFGTGDMAGVMDSLYDAVPPSVGQGTYSATHAQMYSRFGFWVFAHTIYHYTMPHPVFYYAYQAMVEALPQVVREVFDT